MDNNISDFVVHNGGSDMRTGGGANNMNYAIIGGIVLTIIIVVIIVSNKKFKANPFAIKKTERLTTNSNNSDPLGDAGWELHVANCPYCVKQKEILRKHFPGFKNIFSGARQTNVVPFWYNTKTKEERPGLQNLNELNKMARG